MRALFLSRLRPEMRYTLIVCCALGLFFTAVVTVGVPLAFRGAGSGVQASAALGKAPILFVPDRGNVCKQHFIDNSNWTVTEGGHVVCDDEVSWNVGQPAKYSAESRLDAVRAGFSRK